MTKNSYVWVDVIIRTNFFVSCGTHFVKQQFSEANTNTPFAWFCGALCHVSVVPE